MHAYTQQDLGLSIVHVLSRVTSIMYIYTYALCEKHVIYTLFADDTILYDSGLDLVDAHFQY